MKKISVLEQSRVLGGADASTCRELVYRANTDGKKWSAKTWDAWSVLFEKNC